MWGIYICQLRNFWCPRHLNIVTSIIEPFHASFFCTLLIIPLSRNIAHSAWLLTSEPTWFKLILSVLMSSLLFAKILRHIFHFLEFVFIQIANLINVLSSRIICWDLRYESWATLSRSLSFPRGWYQRWRSLNCVRFLLSYSEITTGSKSSRYELIISSIAPREHTLNVCDSWWLPLFYCWV